MILTDYRIELDGFSGPLDLLLHLVRRREMDISRIALAKIAEDFQSLLRTVEFLDLDLVGDFVVVASTLLEIKSREVLPRQEIEQVEEDESEPAGDLIVKLMEYKKFKNAAHELESRAAAWLERYPRLQDDRPDAKRDWSADRIKGVELWDLVSALARIVQMPDAEQETSIRMDETPISVFQERIRQRLNVEQRAEFSSFFAGEKLQSRIVGIFQALLELIRHERYRAEQPVEYGEIFILPPTQRS